MSLVCGDANAESSAPRYSKNFVDALAGPADNDTTVVHDDRPLHQPRVHQKDFDNGISVDIVAR
jgi:hypothetical protein